MTTLEAEENELGKLNFLLGRVERCVSDSDKSVATNKASAGEVVTQEEEIRIGSDTRHTICLHSSVYVVFFLVVLAYTVPVSLSHPYQSRWPIPAKN